MDTMLSFLAPLELSRRLRIKAAQLDISRSAALRRAAEEWLDSFKCPICDDPTFIEDGARWCEACDVVVEVIS